MFRHSDGSDGEAPYEERILLWEAEGFEAAIQLAEAEAVEYAEDVGADYLGLAQAFFLGSDISVVEAGTEVYSLIRDSEFEPEEYLDAFFDTGAEYQRDVGDE